MSPLQAVDFLAQVLNDGQYTLKPPEYKRLIQDTDIAFGVLRIALTPKKPEDAKPPAVSPKPNKPVEAKKKELQESGEKVKDAA